GHHYLARLALDRAEIERIKLEYVRPDAELILVRASLYDALTGISTPLSNLTLPPQRWRRVESFGPVGLYENLKSLPRAWFVKQVVTLPSAEVLRAIKTGRLPDGQLFDPAEIALLDA